MSDGNYPSGNCPDRSCGTCTGPCQSPDTDSFDALVARGPLDYDGLADAEFVSDTDALGCSRWDGPSAECDIEACIHNYFCFQKYTDLTDSPWVPDHRGPPF